MNRIELLDHGFVRLIDSMGSDLSIVRNARVSHDAAWRAGKDSGSDERLINFLYENGHNTPFESVQFTFEIKAPIFVFRQWHRHRTWSYNEVSARYTELPEEFYVPDPHLIGSQSKTDHQARDLHTGLEDSHQAEQHLLLTHMMSKHNESAFELYRTLIAQDVPRELARSVLPVSTYSHMFGSVNLHNLFRFLNERCSNHAQYEIRVYANAILELIEPVVPVAVAAWRKLQ